MYCCNSGNNICQSVSKFEISRKSIICSIWENDQDSYNFEEALLPCVKECYLIQKLEPVIELKSVSAPIFWQLISSS